jgi:hypothetical protein
VFLDGTGTASKTDHQPGGKAMHATNQSQTTRTTNERDAAIQISCNSQLITSSTEAGVTYYSTERRGVGYIARQTSWGAWWVGSHRKSLGRHVGGGRYYASLEDLAAGCKAFAALPVLISLANR